MSNNKLEWGISSDRDVPIAWGARAIYRGPGTIDLLHDRMGMVGGTDEQRKEFGKWLNEYGIPAIKKLTTSENLYTNEDRRVSTDIDGWFIVVNPRSSCGYLYIGVYPCDNGDPNYIPAPVPSPTPVKAKRR